MLKTAYLLLLGNPVLLVFLVRRTSENHLVATLDPLALAFYSAALFPMLLSLTLFYKALPRGVFYVGAVLANSFLCLAGLIVLPLGPPYWMAASVFLVGGLNIAASRRVNAQSSGLGATKPAA